MEIVSLTKEQATRSVGAQLSVASIGDQLTPEFLAASLRRAASLTCPTTPTALVTAVDQAIAPLFSDADRRSRCREILQDLIAIGDLMEYADVALADTYNHGGGRRLVYVAPPYFVELSDARLLVLGIAPDAIDPVPDDLRLTVSKHVRSILLRDQPDARQILLHSGFHEVPYAAWAKAPNVQSADEMVSEFDRALNRTEACGEIENLRILNSSIVSPWYKERWGTPRGLTGRFVGARPRRYGADLWCYIELDNGVAQRLVDLPRGRTLERGCDQAWRLQCAHDAELGHPQTYKVSEFEGERIRIDIHIPCPNWLQRRWDCIGARAGESVFSYIFESCEQAAESQILESHLWMNPE